MFAEVQLLILSEQQRQRVTWTCPQPPPGANDDCDFDNRFEEKCQTSSGSSVWNVKIELLLVLSCRTDKRSSLRTWLWAPFRANERTNSHALEAKLRNVLPFFVLIWNWCSDLINFIINCKKKSWLGLQKYSFFNVNCGWKLGGYHTVLLIWLYNKFHASKDFISSKKLFCINSFK